MENYHFFWRGILSNWTYSEFTHLGFKYNCGEQMMMHQKALLFNDHIIALQIMDSVSPSYIQSLGRMIRNFDPVIWDEKKKDIVKAGLISRFTQDLVAKEALLKHKGKVFVEASPYDKIWGIGYTNQEALDNFDEWGENLLGVILTEISNEI